NSSCKKTECKPCAASLQTLRASLQTLRASLQALRASLQALRASLQALRAASLQALRASLQTCAPVCKPRAPRVYTTTTKSVRRTSENGVQVTPAAEI
uniref:Si:ch211-246m6.4 n=1 Tax=Macrostomum lignano TaxID=282301 RepID=A0A1I8F5E8_9PLAT